MKKNNIIIIFVLFSFLLAHSAEWEKMTRSEKLQHLKDLKSSSNYKDVIKYGEMFIDEGKPKSTDITYAETHNLVGIAYKNTKNYSKAEEFYKKAIKLYRDDLGKTLSGAIVEKNLGLMYADMAEYSKMITSLKNAAPAIEEENDYGTYNSDLSLLYYWLGYGYNQTFSYDSAIVYANKAITLDTKVSGKYSSEVGGDYVVLGNAYSNKYDSENAKKYFREALSILEYVDDYEDELFELGVAYNDYGVFFVNNYENDSAIYYYRKAVNVFENSYDDGEAGNSYNNMGYAYSYKYSYEEAKKYFEKAYNLYKDEYGEYDSRTIEAKKNFDEMKAKTSTSTNTYQQNNTYDSDDDDDYVYTPKKKSCMSNFEGCLDIFDEIGDKNFSILFAADYMQSAGKYYVGGGLGYFSMGSGLSIYYYWSPTPFEGTSPKYIPLVYSFGFSGFSYDLSLDIPSLFDNSYSKNKSASKPYAFGFGAGVKLLNFVQVKCQYIWGPGGYLPRGLSLNAGIEFFI